MKLSEDTLEVLKNFSKINTEMLFQEGNVQYTISAGRNLFGYARIVESLPASFAIYDMNAFLGVMSLYGEDMELDFKDTEITLRGRGGRSKTKYRTTPPKLLKTNVPSRAVFEEKLGSLAWDVSFDMSKEDFKWLRDTAQTLQSPHFSIESKGDTIQMTTFDLEDASKTTQTLDVGVGNGTPFRAVYLTQNLRCLLDDFTVTVAMKTNGTVKFATKNRGVDYYLAAEQGHTKYGN
jgi:hypothetical protein